MTHRFTDEESAKKYYHEYECNIRSRLGEIEGQKESCYDLHKSTDIIIEDIVRQIQMLVIPTFEALNSRDAILLRRREYPRFDLLNNHLILLEEAMIHGRCGDTAKAAETFNLYYHLFENAQLAQKDSRVIKNHLRYLDGLAVELGIEIRQ